MEEDKNQNKNFRLSCLDIASRLEPDSNKVLALATKFSKFVNTGGFNEQ